MLLRRVLAIVTGGLLLSAGGVAAVFASEAIPEQGAIPGLRIGGVEVGDGADIRTHVVRRRKLIEERSVELRLPNDDGEQTRVGVFTLGDLGVSLDVDTVTRRARAQGRRGGWGVRSDELLRARRGELNVPLKLEVNAETLAKHLEGFKELWDRGSRPARFDLEAGTIIADEPGRYIDVDTTAERLREAAFDGNPKVEVAVAEARHTVNVDYLKRLDKSTTLSEFKTHFSTWGDGANRSVNIATAASKLDGIVLAPGQLVSFNQWVGARTLENGFRPGWEIYKGEMVRGVGGGTCQVSSTLHAAAVYAGLDIVERYPHSRPSKYISLGLDSTVAWPSVDLKLKNPWPFPVVVDTHVEKGTITVRLLGERSPAKVKWSGDTLDIVPFDRKITESTWLAEGTVIKKQKGIRGYRIRRTRVLELSDGTVRKEVTTDVYPPTHEHYIVPRGANLEEALPPPPEGSKGYEKAQREAAAEETALLEEDATITGADG